MIPTIPTLNKKIATELQEKIDFKTKPIGALGTLEIIALQIGLIQGTTTPQLTKPTIMVFAGDHGIAKANQVNAYPQEVTQQMVLNFLNDGAGINVFCNQNNIDLQVIDAGVNANFESNNNLINAKIAKGTADYSQGKAMTEAQCLEALTQGKKLVQKAHKNGTNCIGFGEMGIGNTSSASLLMSYFTKISIEDCVGKGTGLNNQGVNTKAKILKGVFDLHKDEINNPLEALQCFGGFEIAMLCGAMLEAGALGMTILIDGFIVTASLLVAQALQPNILEYSIFCHNSNEQGHQKMLHFLNAKPILNLGLRLGEGTGCALAYPIIESSINFLNQMATFKSANVSEAN